jgi:hypothetical protein
MRPLYASVVALTSWQIASLWFSAIAAGQQVSPPSAAFTYHHQMPSAEGPELTSKFSSREIEILESLNRADAAHLPKLERLVVPDTWADDRLAYSPFPRRYAWREDAPKLLVVDQPAQVFAAYERGHLVRWGPVSSGRRAHPTPSGLLHLNWRSRGRHSTVNPDWFMPWYFNFHNERGLSLHEYALPGHPASHARIRLLERDARWLFDWGETWRLDRRESEALEHGTPLLIHGCYEYDAPPPWTTLAWWQRGVRLPATPITEQQPCTPTS